MTTRHLSIADALAIKLEREPTHRELCEEVKRILAEGRDEINRNRSSSK